MKNIIQFIKGTRISSKILFVVWVVFSIFSDFANESKWLEILDFTVIILWPVLVYELCVNPVSIQSNNWFLKFMRYTQILSRVLFCCWPIFVLLFSFGDLQFFLASCLVFTIIFLIPAIIWECIKNPMCNKNALPDIKQDKSFYAKITYNGVYLSDEQIHNLNNNGELPNVQVPLHLVPDEIAVYYSKATLQDQWFKFSGKLIVTNKRVVFLSDFKQVELYHEDITDVEALYNRVCFSSGILRCLLYVPHSDLAIQAFNRVRLPLGLDDFQNNIDDEFDDQYDEDFDDVSCVDGMEGHDFEYYCADLLRKNGFSDVSVTQGSGDQGVDILATKYGIKYAIQCKNYASALSNKPIQEVNAGKTFYHCHVGVVLTNSTFTPGAKALAEATGVLLWDRETLHSMINSMEEK